MNAALVALALVAFGVAALITVAARDYALRRSLIDHPNARGAHAAPTPRGGGISILATYVTMVGMLAAGGALGWKDAVAIGGAGLIVGAIGFLDDHGNIRARWRLLAHFAAAAWLLAWLGEVPGGGMFGGWGIPDSAAYALFAIGIVWLVNLYNFMDGIDGIASVEAVTVAFGGAILAILAGHPELAPLHLLLAASVCGFLFWNWPPATVFMGDVGSGFLGIVLAALALLASRAAPLLLVAWAILLAVFIVDSGVTLARRALRGERVYEAHRMHAYQYAARHFGSHLKVTLAVGAINFFWLLPVGMAVLRGWLTVPVAIAAAYLPIVVLAWRLGAGSPDDEGGGAVAVGRAE